MSTGDVLLVRGAGFGPSPSALFGPYDGGEALAVAPCDDGSPADGCLQVTVPTHRRRSLRPTYGLCVGGASDSAGVWISAVAASVDDDGVASVWGGDFGGEPYEHAVRAHLEATAGWPRVTECT